MTITTKYQIGDKVQFEGEWARIQNVYTSHSGKLMYTVGSSKHQENIEFEAEDFDK
jgi:hypothetical protein